MSERLTKFKELVDIVLGSVEGKELLKMLQEEYGNTAVRQTPELTYYALGQKELLETLVSIRDNKDFLKQIDVKHN